MPKDLDVLTDQELLKLLESAYVTCSNCGSKYGVYSVGCSSVWQGVCDVCGNETPVTEARDYAYFYTTISKLKRKLKAKTKS
jgi:translation initiation factor 2 beta subunit (eIF-2beta)/eIF-5